MARSMASMATVFLVAFLLLACVAREANAMIACSQVVNYMVGCTMYLQGKGPLTSACCNGVNSLRSVSRNTPDQQVACNCLKIFARQIPNYNSGIGAGLPGKCGVNIPYPISTSTDCSKVH